MQTAMGQLATAVSQIQQNNNVMGQVLGQLATQIQQENNVTRKVLSQLLSSVSQLQVVHKLKNESRGAGTVFTYVSSKHLRLHRNLTA